MMQKQFMLEKVKYLEAKFNDREANYMKKYITCLQKGTNYRMSNSITVLVKYGNGRG